jgi:hypothetical protein
LEKTAAKLRFDHLDNIVRHSRLGSFRWESLEDMPLFAYVLAKPDIALMQKERMFSIEPWPNYASQDNGIGTQKHLTYHMFLTETPTSKQHVTIARSLNKMQRLRYFVRKWDSSQGLEDGRTIYWFQRTRSFGIYNARSRISL